MSLSALKAMLNGGGNEEFVSVDIGTSSIKLMELDVSGERPRLKNAGLAPAPAGAIKNNVIVKPDEVAGVIQSIIEANGIEATQVVTAIPGPSVFTKKIAMGYASPKELAANIEYEAGNYIPHNIDAVHLDYQVLGPGEGSTLDILLVAVKNEIVESFQEAIEAAGLDLRIADVDYFAMENMFEINYPEELERTVALINIGARYTSINILQDGESLFTGDVGVGARLYTDALCETLNIKSLEAEQVKMGYEVDGIDPNLVAETIDRTTEHIASELHRQLGFFWNAAATDQPIEAVYLCGGGTQVSGLVDELGTKTGMTCNLIDAFRGIDVTDGFDEEYLQEIALSMAVSVGLAARRAGDKENIFE